MKSTNWNAAEFWIGSMAGVEVTTLTEGGKPTNTFSERLLATMNADTVRNHLAATVAQKGYSYLNATIGLTPIARRAGM